jgi:hypothetical protein
MTLAEIQPGETVTFDEPFICDCGNEIAEMHYCEVCKKGTFGKRKLEIVGLVFGRDTIESIKEKQRQEEAERRKDKH